MNDMAPVTTAQSADLLDQIYGGIRAPETWPDIVRAVGDSLGADIGIMLAPSFNGALPVPLVAYGLDIARIADAYLKHAGKAEFTHRALATGRVPGAFLLDELMPKEEQASSTFWQDLIVPLGVTSGIFAMLRTPDDNHRTVLMNFYRTGAHRDFTMVDVQQLNVLMPHLRRALGVVLDAPPGNSAPNIKELYNAIGAPCFFFNTEARVIHVNHAGRLLLEADDGVRLLDGRLVLSDAPAQLELNAALTRTIGEDWSAKFRTGAELLARRASGGAPLVLVAIPIGADNAIAALAAPARCALFVLEEKLRSNGLLAERLQRLYGLTSAETDICIDIAGGAIPAEIAERRGTTSATVRSQVKAALGKTGARRQADLAALVNRLRF
ncbi:MAG: helix-turn-helix transcriptional regulator [Proteobacteria bacterium]|nr:helix-turn-helix transcriptional regulator [Pseudomonadota bacterium]